MNAILYARFSPRPDAAEAESIDTQRDRMTQYCRAKGWPIIDTHQDADLSGGRADNRPGLQAALSTSIESSKTGQTALVVYSLSRLARNTADAIAISDRLKRAGVALVSLSESIDTSTPSGNLFFTLLAAVAQWEREEIGKRTKDALARAKSQGRAISKSPPYGYKIERKSCQCNGGPCKACKGKGYVNMLVKDEIETEIKTRIIEMRDGDLTAANIATRLKHQGIMARSGHPFAPNTIKGILCRLASK